MKRHTRYLVELLRTRLGPDIQRGAEVGVWRGYNAWQLLKNFPKLTLWAVDSYRTMQGGTDTHATADAQEAYKAALEQMRHYTQRTVWLIMDSQEAAGLLLPASLDFAFVDAAHDYPSVVKDLAAYWPAVRPGGIFCGHDYDGRGDRRGWFGVKRAVDEFAARYGLVVGTVPGHVWWVAKGVQ